MADQFSISGSINFPSDAQTFSGAKLMIRLEAIGMMDAAAQVVAQATQQNVSYQAHLPFVLRGTLPESEDHTRYNVRVHISLDGSDDISKGDYLTKQSYTVLQDSTSEELTVEVERV